MEDLRNQAEVGSRMRNIRNSMGITQGKMADKLGISLNYLAMLERGERSGSLSVMKKLSNLSGLSLDEILYGTQFSEDENMNTYLLLTREYQPEKIATALRHAAAYLEMEGK